MRQWRLFFSRRISLRFCYLVQNGWDVSLWLRYTIKCKRIVIGATGSICKYVDWFFFFFAFFVFFTCLNILKSILKKKVDYHYFHIYRVRSTACQRASFKLRQKKCLKKKKNSNMLDKTSCFSVCYQILLRPLIDCKIVVLRGLSTDFFEQVILNPPLWPNSNKQEGSCSK